MTVPKENGSKHNSHLEDLTSCLELVIGASVGKQVDRLVDMIPCILNLKKAQRAAHQHAGPKQAKRVLNLEAHKICTNKMQEDGFAVIIPAGVSIVYHPGMQSVGVGYSWAFLS